MIMIIIHILIFLMLYVFLPLMVVTYYSGKWVIQNTKFQHFIIVR
jgi:hypothetical protein